MTEIVDVPAEVYAYRAANTPRPAGLIDNWVDAHLTVEHATEYEAATGRVFWADVSSWQRVVNASYPWQQLCIRLDTGYSLDSNAHANVSAWKGMHRTGPLMGYVVFISGQSRAILNRIKAAFGSDLDGIRPMIDMESGSGFAGPGNHSSEANDFAAALAAIVGQRGVIGYANGGDWAHNWPTRPAWMHRIVANYSSTVVSGVFAQQFYGGMPYAVPSGWPRAVAPFGSHVDLNSAAMTTAQLNVTLGLVAPPKPAPPKPTPIITKDDDMAPMLYRVAGHGVFTNVFGGYTHVSTVADEGAIIHACDAVGVKVIVLTISPAQHTENLAGLK